VPGFLHIDIKYLPQMPDEAARRYLYVAIDRATRWVHLEILDNKEAATAAGFLVRVIDKAPFDVYKCLTDNGKEFTDRYCTTGERQPTGRHAFDLACAAHAIEHRLSPPRHPQTNGMVERFNGRIAEVLNTHRFDDSKDLEHTLIHYLRVYNDHIPQRALGHLTPRQAIQEWRIKRPDLFTKPDNNQAGLDSGEILAQVVLARALRPLRKVVFMGMGEPAHNLENVLAAIELLGTLGDFGHKNLVFSSVGDRRIFQRLARGPVRPALALSLHSTDPLLRQRLLPKAPAIDPAELVQLAERYARATGYPIQYQWTLLEGINDSDAELAGIVHLLAGKYAIMNLIPYNAVEGPGFRRPSGGRMAEMVRTLSRRGILTKLRNSAGQEIDGGCGQLRARVAMPVT